MQHRLLPPSWKDLARGHATALPAPAPAPEEGPGLRGEHLLLANAGPSLGPPRASPRSQPRPDQPSVTNAPPAESPRLEPESVSLFGVKLSGNVVQVTYSPIEMFTQNPTLPNRPPRILPPRPDSHPASRASRQHAGWREEFFTRQRLCHYQATARACLQAAAETVQSRG